MTIYPINIFPDITVARQLSIHIMIGFRIQTRLHVVKVIIMMFVLEFKPDSRQIHLVKVIFRSPTFSSIVKDDAAPFEAI